MYILVTICAVTFPEVQRCGFVFFFLLCRLGGGVAVGVTY